MGMAKVVCSRLAFGVALAHLAFARVEAQLDEVCPMAGDEAVTVALKPIRQRHQLPAIAGAVEPPVSIERSMTSRTAAAIAVDSARVTRAARRPGRTRARDRASSRGQ